MLNNKYIQQEPPPYENYNQVLTNQDNNQDNNQVLINQDNNQDDNSDSIIHPDLIIHSDNNDYDLPEYDDDDAERFLEQSTPKKKLCSEKIYQTLFITLFLLVNIIFFSFIIKPNFSDTCARYNSTCFSRYICDNYNRCYYKNTCYDCNSFTTWTFVIIIANCLPTTIIFYCIIKLFNRITNYNY